MKLSDKYSPSYDLLSIQKAFDHPDKLRMTSSAKRGQNELHFSDEDVVAAIQQITQKDFYKSMAPVHVNFVAWQDVYKSFFKNVELYIKFQIHINEEFIISFKEK